MARPVLLGVKTLMAEKEEAPRARARPQAIEYCGEWAQNGNSHARASIGLELASPILAEGDRCPAFPDYFPTEPRQKRCILVRVSSDRQDSASIRRRTEKARQYAADHGYIVIHVYVDYAKSGAYRATVPTFSS